MRETVATAYKLTADFMMEKISVEAAQHTAQFDVKTLRHEVYRREVVVTHLQQAGFYRCPTSIINAILALAG